MRFAHGASLALMIVALTGCGDDALELIVELRTDLVAGQEFDRVRVILEPGGIEEADAMEISYLDGVRIAEFGGLSAGDHTVIVSLFDDAAVPLIERTVRIDLRETIALTVLVSRDCREVACDDAQSCRGGVCVEEGCSDLAPELCPASECAGDGECTEGSACAVGVCRVGACLYQADHGACGMEQWCSPDDGCLDLPGVPPTGTMIDGVSYAVPGDFVLDAPLGLDDAAKATLMGRAQVIAFPPPGSGFADGPYVGTSGDSDMGVDPALVRFAGGAPIMFATSDGVTGPDRNFSQVQFTDPTTGWGDFLLVCSASAGGGDGLFAVDAAGTFSEFDRFNNCNGLVFDHDDVLVDAGFGSPLYVNDSSQNVARYRSDAVRVLVTASLRTNAAGYRAHIATAGRFLGAMYLVSRAESLEGDGEMLRVDSVEPWAHVDWVLDQPDPYGAVFSNDGPLGDDFFVAMSSAGELRAYAPDGTFRVVVAGLLEPAGVAIDRDGALWIIERGRGQVLRLRP